MNNTEKKLYTLIKPHLPGVVSRVENYAEAGTPDVSGCYENDYWIELKICRTKNIDIVKLIEPSQLSWHFSRARIGSIIFVIVRHFKAIRIYQAVIVDRIKLTYFLHFKDEKINNKYKWNIFKKVIEVIVTK